MVATLNIRAGRTGADRVPSSQDAETHTGDPSAPGGTSFWSLKRERLLTMFAVATVMTTSSFAVLFVAEYFAVSVVKWFGLGMAAIAVIAWWIAYFVVMGWIFSDLAARFSRWQLRSRK